MVRVRFSTCAQPYDTAEELIASVRDDRLLEITAAKADHDRKHPLFDGGVAGTFDRFRAVHDILGHAYLGAGFDRHGEYATWRLQERFHSRIGAAGVGDRAARQAQRLLDRRRATRPQGDLHRPAAAARPPGEDTRGVTMSTHAWTAAAMAGRQVHVALRDGNAHR